MVGRDTAAAHKAADTTGKDTVVAAGSNVLAVRFAGAGRADTVFDDDRNRNHPGRPVHR